MNEETPEEMRMAYYLPKVVEEAVRLHHPEVFIGDMIQEGNIVLMLALKEIQKEKDEEEILEQIRAGMLAALESQTEVKRRDHKMVEKVTELDETIKSMKEEYGRKVSVDEVADRLGSSKIGWMWIFPYVSSDFYAIDEGGSGNAADVVVYGNLE